MKIDTFETTIPQSIHVPPAQLSRRGFVRARAISSTDYYEYIPARLDRRAPLLVTVHGISLNAREHAELFAPQAERLGIAVVAPVFDPERFPGFQRPGGPQGRSVRFLEDVVAHVRARHRLARSRFSLVGFSGGAQFAHRYALLRPQRVHALIVVSAGWYTFPDRKLLYPLGIGRRAGGKEPRVHLWRFLRLPVRIAVGELDGERDPALNLTPEIDALQGCDRIERSQRWADALRSAARKRGLVPRVSHTILPRTSHSFAEAVRDGGLAEIVFDAMY